MGANKPIFCLGPRMSLFGKEASLTDTLEPREGEQLVQVTQQRAGSWIPVHSPLPIGTLWGGTQGLAYPGLCLPFQLWVLLGHPKGMLLSDNTLSLPSLRGALHSLSPSTETPPGPSAFAHGPGVGQPGAGIPAPPPPGCVTG